MGMARAKSLEVGGSILNVVLPTSNTPLILLYSLLLNLSDKEGRELEDGGLEVGGSILNVVLPTGNMPPISLYPPTTSSISFISFFIPEIKLKRAAKQLMFLSVVTLPLNKSPLL